MARAAGPQIRYLSADVTGKTRVHGVPAESGSIPESITVNKGRKL